MLVCQTGLIDHKEIKLTQSMEALYEQHSRGFTQIAVGTEEYTEYQYYKKITRLALKYKVIRQRGNCCFMNSPNSQCHILCHSHILEYVDGGGNLSKYPN